MKLTEKCEQVLVVYKTHPRLKLTEKCEQILVVYKTHPRLKLTEKCEQVLVVYKTHPSFYGQPLSMNCQYLLWGSFNPALISQVILLFLFSTTYKLYIFPDFSASRAFELLFHIVVVHTKF